MIQLKVTEVPDDPAVKAMEIAKVLSSLLASKCKPYDAGGYIVLDDCNNWFLRWRGLRPGYYWIEFRNEATRPLEWAFAEWVRARNAWDFYKL